MNHGARAVVLRALGLGDLLTAVPALRAVRRALPDHEVLLLGPSAFAPLVEHAELADAVVPVEGKDALPLAVAPLGPVDVAVNLHGRGPQSHHLLQALNPRRLIAFSRSPVHRGLAAWRDDEHEVHRWTRLLTTEGMPADPGELALEPPDAGVAAATTAATVLHPGASAPARRWPVERWAALAAAEREDGHRVVVTAGPGEQRLAMDVAAGAGLRIGDVITTPDALTLLAVIAAAGAVVVGDTGVAHVATAMATPSVVLFGPTSPARWGPPAIARHRVLWAGRQGDAHGRCTHDGLLMISVEDVRAELAGLRAQGQAVGQRDPSDGPALPAASAKRSASHAG
jgi:ADP-heptose:LPS heptosyltransferase